MSPAALRIDVQKLYSIVKMTPLKYIFIYTEDSGSKLSGVAIRMSISLENVMPKKVRMQLQIKAIGIVV